MRTLDELKAALTPDQLRLLVGALEQRALLLNIEGSVYAACPYGGIGWWVYELSVGSREYFVERGGARCTCPQHEAVGRCKHADALKGTSTAVDTVMVPWRDSDRPRKRRRRPRGGRPNERGET
jgi:hypothetical protein